MSKKFLLTIGILAALNGAMLPTAYAEITKCQSPDGQITYTNSACVDAVPIAHIGEISNTTTPVESSSKVIMRPLIEMPTRHDSAWAQPITRPAHKSTDASTLAEARETMRAMDRALAAMRSHTMVSSR